MSQRDIKTTKTDGVETTFLTPQEQAEKDAREAETGNLKPTKSLKGFLRIFRMTTQDR
ncbi:hypothetical protein [Planctomyces sp. SH-PL14]|uniref:hypothetical protein n=1 Tax=Planctomyces sp. SH-PL14 TaxID=1632864 RepID=UPI00078D0729|nr:hypothetical protein [Planctomyces sp. SH-PL14]AMV18251.1 hypothetical protein VT03_10205 [Planctomyces sp. SH-PL14]